MLDSPGKRAVNPLARATAIRWTALGASLTLAVGLSAFAADALAKSDRPKVPLPKPRPIARNVVPKTTLTARPSTQPAALDTLLRRSNLPPASMRRPTRGRAKPPPPPAMAATSSTPQADTDTLENVIELVRNHKPADATQAAAAISDPVARKLAEWIILRSDNNGASVERYRAFIDANPSWPSQTFLRRRIEAALWDDHRDDATVLAWFANEKPLSAKGKFSLAKALLARGDRANAERLIRDAWRFDSMSSDTEEIALDLFGALLTPGDQKARMDSMLYGSEQEAGMRAAKRIGQVALAKARNAAYRKASNTKPCSTPCRMNCMAIPAICSHGFNCSAAKRNSRKPHN